MNRPYVIPKQKQLISSVQINQWYANNQYIIEEVALLIDSFIRKNDFLRSPAMKDIIFKFIHKQSM